MKIEEPTLIARTYKLANKRGETICNKLVVTGEQLKSSSQRLSQVRAQLDNSTICTFYIHYLLDIVCTISAKKIAKEFFGKRSHVV